MSPQPEIAKIAEKLANSKFVGLTGKITFNLGAISADLETKDIVGGAIQEWFGHWMKANNIKFGTRNSQVFPDFIINKTEYLEVKCFNWDAGGPAFDIANFGSYVDSLLQDVGRLNSDYLVIAYSMQGSQIEIKNYWWKKVWEISGPSAVNVIEVQKKRGMPYNLRPKKFYSPNIDVFSTPKDFLIALDTAATKFSHPEGHDEYWLSTVEADYASLTSRNNLK